MALNSKANGSCFHFMSFTSYCIKCVVSIINACAVKVNLMSLRRVGLNILSWG